MQQSARCERMRKITPRTGKAMVPRATHNRGILAITFVESLSLLLKWELAWWKFRVRGSSFCVDWSGFGYSDLRTGRRNSIHDAVVAGLDLVQASTWSRLS